MRHFLMTVTQRAYWQLKTGRDDKKTVEIRAICPITGTLFVHRKLFSTEKHAEKVREVLRKSKAERLLGHDDEYYIARVMLQDLRKHMEKGASDV